MGKPTGFMEYTRQDNAAEQPAERIKHFNEFHPPLEKEARREQAARCMDCGVPFCQSCVKLSGMYSGCPLHNLIPEWNDLIYSGSLDQALSRLLKTSNFPEFTGRVCPALCEAACTCGGLGESAVTIRENELFLVEYGFASGLITPHPPTIRSGKKVAVIGSGPAGLACADQLNRRGHAVTVYERADRAGGLLMYGIPNMKLEKSVVERRIRLMQDEGIVFKLGADVGSDVTAAELLASYDAVVLCCGASQPRDLALEGREDCPDVLFAVDFLTQTTKSLLDSQLQDGRFTSAKDKHVVIVGGGDTGNDCVGTALRHGCASVVQLEMMPKPPRERTENNPWPEWPLTLKTDYGQQEALAVFGCDPRLYQTTVKSLHMDEEKRLKEITLIRLQPERDAASGRTIMKEVPGSEQTVPCDLLLIACGFTGPQAYILDAFGLETTPRRLPATSENSFATSVDKVFVAGDMHRGQSLVVWAMAEGRAAAAEVDQYLMGYSGLRNN